MPAPAAPDAEGARETLGAGPRGLSWMDVGLSEVLRAALGVLADGLRAPLAVAGDAGCTLPSGTIGSRGIPPHGIGVAAGGVSMMSGTAGISRRLLGLCCWPNSGSALPWLPIVSLMPT
mmetsp:Transcript_18556/g.51128  ORF Transcript_18556/g.51128 Transcript_18556/m.51128 type:complete len:119 (+) Transcript_18556:183-539(+)